MWRVLMLEDAIFNATIQTARRHAAPIKVAKLGNAATGWIPPPEQEKRLLELLAQAEQDPNAWLVYHYGIAFETIGTTDRALNVSKEWDILERIKLVAMGISKSFLHGEVSYASSATGLQVFLQRLKSLRLFFEQKWLYPKFFKPIAEINGWIKPKPSEVMHRFRVKRSKRELEEQNAYIMPKIVWDKSLDPQVSMDLINAMAALEGIGVKFSKTSKMATVGYSFEEETKKIHRENEFEKEYLPAITMPQQQDTGGPGGGAPMGGGGGMPPDMGAPPGMEGGDGPAPPGMDGEQPPGVNAPPAAPQVPGASKQATGDKSSIDKLKSKIWSDDKHGNWSASDVSDLIDILNGNEADGAFFDQIKDKIDAVDDIQDKLSIVSDFLNDKDYPDDDISDLMYILEEEGIISKGPNILDLPDNIDQMADKDFADAVAKLIKKNKPSFAADTFLTGVDTPSI
jgi:hypothetical protein